ncbi:hypothetical protein E2C01_067062 [Portunus trituberculatus]|uniref:Uncharacterized protein n=1 Tax=Portunus trituberculatus TaxID=210409 RepID=A0A5B7HSK7_PORTR|nr:hypothetical protein [Portunus trituberculatus]
MTQAASNINYTSGYVHATRSVSFLTRQKPVVEVEAESTRWQRKQATKASKAWTLAACSVPFVTLALTGRCWLKFSSVWLRQTRIPRLNCKPI